MGAAAFLAASALAAAAAAACQHEACLSTSWRQRQDSAAAWAVQPALPNTRMAKVRDHGDAVLVVGQVLATREHPALPLPHLLGAVQGQVVGALGGFLTVPAFLGHALHLLLGSPSLFLLGLPDALLMGSLFLLLHTTQEGHPEHGMQLQGAGEGGPSCRG